jgi:hypothetical protein
MEKAIEELQKRYPAMDVDALRQEIYAEVPNVQNLQMNSEYQKLDAIEAKMLVDLLETVCLLLLF